MKDVGCVTDSRVHGAGRFRFVPLRGGFSPSERPGVARLRASRPGADVARPARSALAGAGAALVWALQEPLDQRVFRYGYSDVAVLGKAVTRGRRWRAVGLAAHACNGAAFGLAYEALRRRVPLGSRKLALGMALAEHVSLYPLCWFVDRHHPARGEAGVPPLLTSPRAFAQATWRHALFGALLGRLA